MKVAIIGESACDETVVRILAEAILQQPLDVVSVRRRAGGVSEVIAGLPNKIRHLYFQTDVSAVIVVLDSDLTPVHTVDHDQSPDPDCRVCELESTARKVLTHLPPRPIGLPFHFIPGQAVPSIEAWGLCATDHTVGNTIG